MKIYIKPLQTISKHDIPFIQKLNPIYALIYLCFSLYTHIKPYQTKPIISLLHTLNTKHHRTKLKPYINHKYQIWINLNQQKLNYLCHLSLCFSPLLYLCHT
nr:MAG TPA: hypothetical protein [Caudoviricetes sp.]